MFAARDYWGDYVEFLEKDTRDGVTCVCDDLSSRQDFNRVYEQIFNSLMGVNKNNFSGCEYFYDENKKAGFVTFEDDTFPLSENTSLDVFKGWYEKVSKSK